jgi:hypothetical protein
VSVITKSGANDFHGAAFEYLRRDAPRRAELLRHDRRLAEIAAASRTSSAARSAADRQEQGVLFRQLRALPAQCGDQHRRGHAERGGLGARSAGHRRVAAGLPRARRHHPAGQSTNPDFDIAQLQTPQIVSETAASGRFRYQDEQPLVELRPRVSRQGCERRPDSVSGRVVHTEANPSNAIFNLQGVLSDRTTNEFKFGLQRGADADCGRRADGASALGGHHQPDRFRGEQRHRRPGFELRHHRAGRVGSFQQRRRTAARSRTIRTRCRSSTRSGRCDGNHYIKVGGEVRLIRMSTDRLGGTTYSFQNVNAFLANTPSTIQFLGDESAPSVFNNGATGERHIRQEYYIAYAQDEFRRRTRSSP